MDLGTMQHRREQRLLQRDHLESRQLEQCSQHFLPGSTVRCATSVFVVSLVLKKCVASGLVLLLGSWRSCSDYKEHPRLHNYLL